jgi:hypothetical protein
LRTDIRPKGSLSNRKGEQPRFGKVKSVMKLAKPMLPPPCHHTLKRFETSIVSVVIGIFFVVVRTEADVRFPLPAGVNEVEVWPLNAETVLVIVPYSGFAETVSRKGTTNIFRGHGGRWRWDEKNRIAFVPPMTLCTMATNRVRALDFSKWVERVIFTNVSEIKYVAQVTNFVLVQLLSGTRPYQLVSTANGEVKWTIENPGGKVLGMNDSFIPEPSERTGPSWIGPESAWASVFQHGNGQAGLE